MSPLLLLVIILLVLGLLWGAHGYSRPGGWPYGPGWGTGAGIVWIVLLVVLLLLLFGQP